MIKILFQTIILLSISTIAYGQKVLLITEKTYYKIDEVVSLTFFMDANIDSVSKLTETNFKIIKGPATSSSNSTINGKTSYTYLLAYEIRATAAGTIELISPAFYSGSRIYKADKLVLTILGDKLSSEEIDVIKFNEFKDSEGKSNGSLRYVLNEDFGYIEEYRNSEWKLKRRLTKKEIAKLRK